MHREPLLVLTLCFAAACGGAPTTTTTTGTGGTDGAATPAAQTPAKPTGPVRHAKIDTSAAAGVRPLLRETYRYDGAARDPFKSVLVTADRGPELADLKLVSVIYDAATPTNSLVTFREIGGDGRWTWHMGERFGRITVTAVSSADVTLRQDDFGIVHTQAYTLRKPEDKNP